MSFKRVDERALIRARDVTTVVFAAMERKIAPQPPVTQRAVYQRDEAAQALSVTSSPTRATG